MSDQQESTQARVVDDAPPAKTEKPKTSPPHRPATSNATNALVAAAPWGGIGLVQATAAFGPAALLTAGGVGTAMCIGAVARERPRNPRGTRPKARPGVRTGARSGLSSRGGGLGMFRRSGGAGARSGSGRRSGAGVGRVAGGGHGRNRAAGHSSSGRKTSTATATRSRGGANPFAGGRGIKHTAGHGKGSRRGSSGIGGPHGRGGVFTGGGRSTRGTGRSGGKSTGSTGRMTRVGSTGGHGKSSRNPNHRSAAGRALQRLTGGGRRHAGTGSRSRSGGRTSGGRTSGGGKRGGIMGALRRGAGKALGRRTAGHRNSRGGGITGLAGRMFRRSARAGSNRSLARAARKNRRTNQRQHQRRMLGYVWRKFNNRRRRSAHDSGNRSTRRFARSGRVLRRIAGWTAGGAAVLGMRYLFFAGRVGNIVRGGHSDTMATLGIPFQGLGGDLRNLLTRLHTRYRTWRDPRATTVDSTTRPRPMARGTVGEERSAMTSPIRTNLRPIIEAIEEAQALEEGPHAEVVEQYIQDFAELFSVIANRAKLDMESAAETLPVDGNAHELTLSLSSSTENFANEVDETRDAWHMANGTRWSRLVDARENPQGEAAWDVSTAPSQQ